MLCLLLQDFDLYIPQSCHLVLVSFDWNGKLVPVQQVVVLKVVVVGDYAMNAMNVEVVIVLVDTGDVVDVGTAKRWVDSEPKHQQQMLGSWGKL